MRISLNNRSKDCSKYRNYVYAYVYSIINSIRSGKFSFTSIHKNVWLVIRAVKTTPCFSSLKHLRRLITHTHTYTLPARLTLIHDHQLRSLRDESHFHPAYPGSTRSNRVPTRRIRVCTYVNAIRLDC